MIIVGYREIKEANNSLKPDRGSSDGKRQNVVDFVVVVLFWSLGPDVQQDYINHETLTTKLVCWPNQSD